MAEIIIKAKDGTVMLHITNAYIDTSDRKAELDATTQQRVSDAVWDACRRDREAFRLAVRESFGAGA